MSAHARILSHRLGFHCMVFIQNIFMGLVVKFCYEVFRLADHQSHVVEYIMYAGNIQWLF